MKIAIIGTGISGLGVAYLLSRSHNITVFEKNPYIGGHSRTIDIPVNGASVAVDTGFIVFNNWNYPNLMGLFDMLQVPYVKSNMAFGASIDDGWLEYASGDLFALRNMVRPAYWRMLQNIVKFNKTAVQHIESDTNVTLGAYLDTLQMDDWFKKYYLLAMGAAIWSCPISTIMQFPARTFLRFFKNHGLLSINNRPQWYTVQGGSRQYVQRLIAGFKHAIKVDCGVTSVTANRNKWAVTDTQGNTDIYDQVVFACHADAATDILNTAAPSPIKHFAYQHNHIVVHRDTSFMPKHKKCWSSWVYLSENQNDTKPAVSLSYWMNSLQPLQTDTPIIVTLNPGRQPKPDLIYDTHTFSHPIFDNTAITAQTQLPQIQGKNGLWFCGAYHRYGFHEDGLLSAVDIAQKMGIRIPWYGVDTPKPALNVTKKMQVSTPWA